MSKKGFREGFSLTHRMGMLARVAFVAAGTLSVWGAEVEMAQSISLQTGWNAFYLEVTPEQTADEIFAAWPVESVGLYDPASYLETRQYSGTETSEGVRESRFSMWRRGEPAISDLKNLVANGVYVCYVTNGTYSAVLKGMPVAPRTTWHPCSTNETQNYVGLSLQPNTTTTVGQYFSGCDAGLTAYTKVYGVSGNNRNKISIIEFNEDTPLENGQVVVVSATRASDWSGVLNVSPQDGLAFSTNITSQILSIRNDGATDRTVSVTLTQGVLGSGVQAFSALKYRDASVSTNKWADLALNGTISKNLASGETLSLWIAVDRTQLAAGQKYAGVFTIDDVDGGSNMRVTVPITAQGGTDAVRAWPQGLWYTTAKLTKVDYVTATATTPTTAGGTVSVRLPLYVDAAGAMTLLQRYVYGVDTNSETHIYSARTEKNFPVAIGNVARTSSAVLPIDQPVIACTNGTFGSTAAFDWVVSENSRVNPMRHAYHPSHDGLQWDFTTPAPSGDDLENYMGTVKPELFSITNRIDFTWDGTTGTGWSPEETLTGTLSWSLGGVRHEGPITMRGTFTMKRISDVILDK